jgi:hypothetical protein
LFGIPNAGAWTPVFVADGDRRRRIGHVLETFSETAAF